MTHGDVIFQADKADVTRPVSEPAVQLRPKSDARDLRRRNVAFPQHHHSIDFTAHANTASAQDAPQHVTSSTTSGGGGGAGQKRVTIVRLSSRGEYDMSGDKSMRAPRSLLDASGDRFSSLLPLRSPRCMFSLCQSLVVQCHVHCTLSTSACERLHDCAYVVPAHAHNNYCAQNCCLNSQLQSKH